MYTLEFSIQGLPKNVTNNMVHWRKKHAEAKKWKLFVIAEVRRHLMRAPDLKDYRRPKLERAKLTLTRHSSSEPDFDGLVASFKHVIDGLVEAGVIANDKTSNIGQPNYVWVKAKPKQGFITVKVEEV